jgi:para-nitrobenzyl esterase
MKSTWTHIGFLAPLLILVTSAHTQGPQPKDAAGLGGSSWQLGRFEGGDGKTLAPDDKSKYTIAFASDGSVSARIDCNRGRGTWKSDGPGQLQFGPLALTRAMCPPAPLNERIPKDWQYVRSYCASRKPRSV